MLAKDNLTARINLDAQVLNLLEFNAGVGKRLEDYPKKLNNWRLTR